MPRLPAAAAAAAAVLRPAPVESLVPEAELEDSGGGDMACVGCCCCAVEDEEEEDVGAVCWIMTLLTMYLWEGRPEGGGDSLMRDWRVLFCVVSVSMA